MKGRVARVARVDRVSCARPASNRPADEVKLQLAAIGKIPMIKEYFDMAVAATGQEPFLISLGGLVGILVSAWSLLVWSPFAQPIGVDHLRQRSASAANASREFARARSKK